MASYKELRTVFLVQVQDRKQRMVISALVTMFLVIVVAYHICVNNAHGHRANRNHVLKAGHSLGPEKSISELCGVWSDLKPSAAGVSTAGTSGQSVRVETPLGPIEGTVRELFGKSVLSFLGIPYAEPPLGDKRFKRTFPARPWSGPLKATRFRDHCAQYFYKALLDSVHPIHLDMSEDCLYLNVWTPSVRRDGALKPVMLWVHGGGYNMGSVAIEENVGDALSVFGDVVVVTFNMRVGAFGFLDLDTEDAPGNQQIYDMVTAMRWVRSNIASFGGDPDQVTVFAQSSGAMNVALMLMNPTEDRLFRRVILQSGAPTIYDMFYDQGPQTLTKVLEQLNCDSSDPQMALVCLKQRSTEQVIVAQKNIFDKVATSFTPSPGETLLAVMPTDLMAGDYNRSAMAAEPFGHIDSMLIGTNRDEASILLHAVMPKVFEKNKINLNMTKLSELRSYVTNIFNQFVDFPKSQIAALVTTFFADGPEVDTTENLIKRLYDFMGDVAFLCPSKVLAEQVSQVDPRKPVFMYRFSYRPAWDKSAAWMGVPHNKEISFVFGQPLKRPLDFNGADIEMSRTMMAIWTQFARTGTVPDVNGRPWPRYGIDQEQFMDLNGNESDVGLRLHSKTCELYKLGGELIS